MGRSVRCPVCDELRTAHAPGCRFDSSAQAASERLHDALVVLRPRRFVGVWKIGPFVVARFDAPGWPRVWRASRYALDFRPFLSRTRGDMMRRLLHRGQEWDALTRSWVREGWPAERARMEREAARRIRAGEGNGTCMMCGQSIRDHRPLEARLRSC